MGVTPILNNFWVRGNVKNQLSGRSNPIHEPITQVTKKTTLINRLFITVKKSVLSKSSGREIQSVNDINNTPPITNIIANSSTPKMASVEIPPTPNHIPAKILKIKITPRLVDSSLIALTVKFDKLKLKQKIIIIVRYLAVSDLNFDKNLSFSINVTAKAIPHPQIVKKNPTDICTASTEKLINLRITLQFKSVMNMTTITCKSNPVIMELGNNPESFL
ncbi:hypothetical protein QUB05_20095 [Microcoleus sp. F10-C6]|uniref:hypothetical protein n=1 Tax=unclassified Microcoleus TaxID=2642155 RepID=UPI002FCEEE0E